MANVLTDQERADLENMPKIEYYEYEVDCTGYPSSSRPRTHETSRSTQPTTPAVEEYDHVAQSWYNPEVYKVGLEVGYTAKHDSKDDEKDCIRGVIKTNIRTPLPIAKRLVTGPHDEKWDLFIQWMYQPNMHGAMMLMNESTVYEIHEKRMEEGAG